MSSDPSAISVDETAVMAAVGAAIVARRTELKISQQALARTVGWISQWKEMIADPQNKIGRPRQLYTGPGERSYVPIDAR